MREIVSVLGQRQRPASWPPAGAEELLDRLYVVQMTQYDEKFSDKLTPSASTSASASASIDDDASGTKPGALPMLFAPQLMTNALSEWLSKQKKTQYHCAETEKYAHVTFFFAGGREEQYENETREMVQSPKVATYDLAPKMAQQDVTTAMIKAMQHGYDFLLCNYAGPDMVGHTGQYDKTIEAVAECDRCIGQLYDACQKYGYTLVVTADHGNAEEMLDAEGKPKTSHTSNLIPLIIAAPPTIKLSWNQTEIAKTNHKQEDQRPGLAHVAPTVLAIMNLSIPPEMEKPSLVVIA